MDATSLEKQKKGNLYVYKFSPITTAGSRTPDHHSTGRSVTKRIIPSSIWGLRKSKPKPKSEPEPKPNRIENVDKIKNYVEKRDIENGNGNENENRKSISLVEGILMSLASGNSGKESGRKSISTVEEKVRKEYPYPFSLQQEEGNGRKSVSHVENNVAYVGKFVEKPRKSLGAKLETNLASTIALLQVKVLVTDMPGFMQVHAFQCARNTYDSLEKFSAKHLAYNLKKEFDKVYGPAWHCIVGSSFGSFVTHATGCFLYFSMEKLCILMFRTKVQRALQQ